LNQAKSHQIENQEAGAFEDYKSGKQQRQGALSPCSKQVVPLLFGFQHYCSLADAFRITLKIY
jgi:hypothetical protein